MRIGIVRAFFNEAYTEEMLEAATKEANKLGIQIKYIVEVPGAHEIPIATKKLLKKDDVDGVATLGTVIKGSTDHDEILCKNVSKQLLEISCKYEKPVGLGIIGPNASWSQVEERTEAYAEKSVDAVYDCLNELEEKGV